MAKCEFHDRERSRCAICSPESVYAGYQRQARDRNLSFSISLAEFEALVNAECHWCGRYGSNGLDRKNNANGYVVNNVVPCCWRCNRAKGSLSEHEWLDLCRTVCANQEKKKKAKLAEQCADTAAEHTPVAEPTLAAAETITTPVQVIPPRTDLAPEAVRFLDTGVRF